MAVAGKQVWAAMTGETNKRNQQPARFVAAVSWPYPRRADSHNPEYDRTSVSVGTFSGTIELPSGWSGYGFLMNGCIDVPPALWRTNLLGDGIRPPSETELAFDATLSQRGAMTTFRASGWIGATMSGRADVRWEGISSSKTAMLNGGISGRCGTASSAMPFGTFETHTARMHEGKEMPIQVQVGLGMNPSRGRDAFAFPISNLISMINSYGQATWQDLF